VSTLEEELTEVELEHLKAETGFETRQVRRLFMRFKHLDRSNKGYLEKSDLLVMNFTPVVFSLEESFRRRTREIPENPGLSVLC